MCRASEQKLLGGSSTSSSDPDLASLDPEEEASGGSGGAQQGAVATHDPSQVQKRQSSQMQVSHPCFASCIEPASLLGRAGLQSAASRMYSFF